MVAWTTASTILQIEEIHSSDQAVVAWTTVSTILQIEENHFSNPLPHRWQKCKSCSWMAFPSLVGGLYFFDLLFEMSLEGNFHEFQIEDPLCRKFTIFFYNYGMYYTLFYKVLLQCYSVLQNTTPALLRTTPVLLRATKYYASTTPYYKLLVQHYSVLLAAVTVAAPHAPRMKKKPHEKDCECSCIQHNWTIPPNP